MTYQIKYNNKLCSLSSPDGRRVMTAPVDGDSDPRIRMVYNQILEAGYDVILVRAVDDGR